MRRVFMTRHFNRWAAKTGLSVDVLCKTIEEMERGLIEANLGGGVVKKRVALPGRGKRGSTRILAATNHRDRWFFIFGFEKNDRDNLTAKELRALKTLADDLLQLSLPQITSALATNVVQEICHDN